MKYLVKYGNTVTETIEAKTMLDAQKAAHKKADKLGTIVINVTTIKTD